MEENKMKKIKILGIVSILLLSGILMGAGNAVASKNAWFLGSGRIGTSTPKVFHSFKINCNANQSGFTKNSLKVHERGNHFSMTMLTNMECVDDPSIDPGRPHATFDTIHGIGEGKLNGMSGYYVEFIFTDAGEPGNVDWGWIKVTDSNGSTILEVSGFLKHGNHQAIGNPW